MGLAETHAHLCQVHSHLWNLQGGHSKDELGRGLGRSGRCWEGAHQALQGSSVNWVALLPNWLIKVSKAQV